MTAQPTIHHIPPAPRRVELDHATHSRLIMEMTAGNTPDAPTAVFKQGRIARNLLLSAYSPWISWKASIGSRSVQASEDRAGHALMRCVEVIDAYNPTHGVPLHAYLSAAAALEGEAVAEAGMPIDTLTRKQRRLAIQTKAEISRPTSLSAPVGEDGLTVGDQLVTDERGPEALAFEVELSESVVEAIRQLSEYHQELLADFWGIGTGRPRTVREMAEARGTGIGAISKAVKRAQLALAESSPELRFFVAAVPETAIPITFPLTASMNKVAA